MSTFDREVLEHNEWFRSPRYKGITRLYSADQVVEQRGTIPHDYTVARTAAEAFYPRLRELFDAKQCITTFGPYSPGQAVSMKRLGIEGIYLGGWATSAKGSVAEDPGPDLASYPLSQVPDEAAAIVRSLLIADKNQQYLRLRMTDEERQASPAADFRPFIIADADTGHGGDPHVRNLIRRFAEVGVPGYHIEDQRPGTKKCGHQGGKVLVPADEQIKRLNAARFQLDIMGVPGIIVARTDAEAASLIDSRADERDQPFLLGATAVGLPSYKLGYLTLLKHLHDLGLDEIKSHLLYAVEDADYATTLAWFERVGLLAWLDRETAEHKVNPGRTTDQFIDDASNRFLEAWQDEAGLATFGDAVAEVLESRVAAGEAVDMGVEEWRAFAGQAPLSRARLKAQEIGVDIDWDCELAVTPEGYYQVKGGLAYAIARSLAVAPFSDLLWMETKTANLDDAREFAKAIHAQFPDKMLAYNLSPSFSWDTTGMSDEEMRQFPDELGKMGFVFNFITYGGHQIDGVASEEFTTGIQQDGMLALARLQRKIRLVDSPYRTHADAGWWSQARWRPGGLVRTHGHDQSHGQGVDTASAPRADRSAHQAARGMAGDVDRALPVGGAATGPASSAAGGFGAARVADHRGVWRFAGERGLFSDSGSIGASDPHGPRPEHVRRGVAEEAFDDVDSLVPGAPIHGRPRALCQPDGRQQLSGRQDEGARDLRDRQPGGWSDHRRRDRHQTCGQVARSRSRCAREADCQARSAHLGVTARLVPDRVGLTSGRSTGTVARCAPRRRLSRQEGREGLLMRNRLTVMTVTAVVMAAGLLVGSPSAGPAALEQEYRASRAPDGRPDLNGIWQTLNSAHWNVEPHPAGPSVVRDLGALAATPGGRGVVEGGEIPYRPDALATRRENFENRLGRDPAIKCYLPGVPRATYMPFPFQIVQSQEHVMIVHEFAGAVRTIYMEDHQPAPAPTLDGMVEWTLGGRHAGGRHERVQRHDLVRQVRQLSQRPATCSGAIHGAQPRDPDL